MPVSCLRLLEMFFVKSCKINLIIDNSVQKNFANFPIQSEITKQKEHLKRLNKRQIKSKTIGRPQKLNTNSLVY